MSESLDLSVVIPAAPHQLYEAWLSSEQHSAFTGGKATIDPTVGGWHTAWDGYIVGRNVALEPHTRIVQTWRTTDFPADCPDSRLEVLFESVAGGTSLRLIHTELPDGQAAEYDQGWHEAYFKPMLRYFGGQQASA